MTTLTQAVQNVNEFKGQGLDYLKDTITSNEQGLSNVERMSLLKELTRFKPGGTINETKRAQAILRSLAQNRGLERTTFQSEYGSTQKNVRMLPAVGRQVESRTLYIPAAKSLKSEIDFYGPTGVEDKPFKGGLKDSKLKGLQYQLGQAMEDLPPNNRLTITATDKRRSTAYQRRTGGALKFSEGPDFLPGTQAKTYINKKGNFQPMVGGKFTKAVPNPAERLKSGLVQAALAADPIYRAVRGATSAVSRVRGADPLGAIMTGADIGKWMRDNLQINPSTSGRGGGRQALND